MINGNLFRDALISASNNLANNRAAVDSLNVFPVPDGDTGINMSMTMSAAAMELSLLGGAGVSEVASSVSSALLRGARGNSGVILSLLFRGISKSLVDKKEIDGTDLAAALSKGVQSAYKAVMKPTEGTMLTVARECAEYAEEFIRQNNDPVALWEGVCARAHVSLENTPNLLPVLKKAGVVDAGGMGLVKIFEGMLSVFKDGIIVQPVESTTSSPAFGFGVEDEEVNIEFPYCTEFIVDKSQGTNKDSEILKNELNEMGNSLVFVDDDGIIKVHVHTKNPGIALQKGLEYGPLITMKIENMIEQYNKRNSKKIVRQAAESVGVPFEYIPVDPSVTYGFVAVAAGEGLTALFSELGVDQMVSGGQTMNPSTEEILSAIHAVPAKTVFVLPNNKNIIMAAEQAVRLADRNVCVLQTRTIPQGLSALLAYDPDASLEENQLNMTKAADNVSTGLVTYAVRDSDYDGHKIKAGEILALENSKVSFSERDLARAVVRLTHKLVKKETSFVTLIYGENVTESQAQEISDQLKTHLSSSIELNLIRGDQPVYYFIISVE